MDPIWYRNLSGNRGWGLVSRKRIREDQGTGGPGVDGMDFIVAPVTGDQKGKGLPFAGNVRIKDGGVAF